jgi:hypothetical protein
MKTSYEDITSRIATDPLWFDEYGVPRYCDFSPLEIVNAYANTCALALISCQRCKKEFSVAFSEKAILQESELEKGILSRTLGYGDPPNIGCCGSGPTMSSVSERVLEFWERRRDGDRPLLDWVRREDLELENIRQDWANAEEEF